MNSIRILIASALAAVTALAAETSSIKYKVDGMSCGACEGKVTAALGKVEGVKVDKVCSKAGCAAVTFDPAKVKSEDVQKAITDSGFKVGGELVSLKVGGMTCGACSSAVTKALKAVPGVSDAKVDHAAGTAAVTVEAGKKDDAALKAAVEKAGFKVSS